MKPSPMHSALCRALQLAVLCECRFCTWQRGKVFENRWRQPNNREQNSIVAPALVAAGGAAVVMRNLWNCCGWRVAEGLEPGHGVRLKCCLHSATWLATQMPINYATANSQQPTADQPDSMTASQPVRRCTSKRTAVTATFKSLTHTHTLVPPHLVNAAHT